MKKVLQVFAHLSRGGLETFVMNLYKGIISCGIQFDFLVYEDGDDYEDEAKKLGARVFKIPPRSLGLIKFNRNLDTFFKTHAREYVAIHQHVSSFSSIEPLYYAYKYKIPVRIVHVHSSSISDAVHFNLIHRILHSLNKKIVGFYVTNCFGCSTKAIDWAFSETYLKRNSKIIKNGIDLKKFTYKKEEKDKVKREFNLKNEIIVGHIGNFLPVKNHKFLIEIFKQYNKKNPNSKLFLIGDGMLREEIEEQIKQYGLEDCIILTGKRKDVYRLLQIFDVLVMPSLFEGMPVALIEAQASGVPVLASDNISRDTKIVDQFKFISLNESNEEWADNIEFMSKLKKADNHEIMVKSGFDIKNTVDILKGIYIG